MAIAIRYRHPALKGASRLEAYGEMIAVLQPDGSLIRRQVANGPLEITALGARGHDLALTATNILVVTDTTLRAYDYTGAVLWSVALTGGAVVGAPAAADEIWTADIWGYLAYRDAAGEIQAERNVREQIIRLVYGGVPGQILAYTNNADLILYQYTAQGSIIQEISRLHVPQGHGLRFFGVNDDGSYSIVGYDRKGAGAVVTTDEDGILSIDRTFASSVVLAGLNGLVGTQISPDEMSWKPWFSPTTALASPDDVETALTPELGELWVYEESPEPALLLEDGFYLLLEDGSNLLLE